jgi:hypothetical protein
MATSLAVDMAEEANSFPADLAAVIASLQFRLLLLSSINEEMILMRLKPSFSSKNF